MTKSGQHFRAEESEVCNDPSLSSKNPTVNNHTND